MTVRRMMPRAVDPKVCSAPTFQLLYEWLVTRRLRLPQLLQILRLEGDGEEKKEEEPVLDQEREQAQSILGVLVALCPSAPLPTENQLVAVHRQLVPLTMSLDTPLCGAHIGHGIYANTRALRALRASSQIGARGGGGEVANCFAFINILDNCQLHIYSGPAGIETGQPLVLAPPPPPPPSGVVGVEKLADLWSVPILKVHGTHHPLCLQTMLVRMSSCLIEFNGDQQQQQQQQQQRRPIGIEACVDQLATELFPYQKKKNALEQTRNALLAALARLQSMIESGNAEAVHGIGGRWQDLVLLFCLVQLLKPRKAVNDLQWVFAIGRAWVSVFSATVVAAAAAAVQEDPDFLPREASIDTPYSLLVGAIQNEAYYNNKAYDKTWFYNLAKAMQIATGEGVRTT